MAWSPQRTVVFFSAAPTAPSSAAVRGMTAARGAATAASDRAAAGVVPSRATAASSRDSAAPCASSLAPRWRCTRAQAASTWAVRRRSAASRSAAPARSVFWWDDDDADAADAARRAPGGGGGAASAGAAASTTISRESMESVRASPFLDSSLSVTNGASSAFSSARKRCGCFCWSPRTVPLYAVVAGVEPAETSTLRARSRLLMS